MAEPERPDSGGSVRFREFDDYRHTASEVHHQMSERIDRNDERIDKLESWRDRIAGPIAVALAILAILATVSNLLIIWVGVIG